MKIVIDIHEEVYKSIQDNDYCGISNADMYNAIKKGTPLDMAIRALKNEQTDGDLISRQAVLDIFGDIHPLDYNARAYVTQIKELPSAEKTAEWLHFDCYLPYGEGGVFYKCSNCRNTSDKFYAFFHYNPDLKIKLPKYCPNCGAKMKGEEKWS